MKNTLKIKAISLTLILAFKLSLGIATGEELTESFDWGSGSAVRQSLPANSSAGAAFDAIGGGSWQVLGGYDNQVVFAGSEGPDNGSLSLGWGDQGISLDTGARIVRVSAKGQFNPEGRGVKAWFLGMSQQATTDLLEDGLTIEFISIRLAANGQLNIFANIADSSGRLTKESQLRDLLTTIDFEPEHTLELKLAVDAEANEINWQIRNLDIDSMFSGTYLLPAGIVSPDWNRLHIQKTGGRASLNLDSVTWETRPGANSMTAEASQRVEQPALFTEEKPPLQIPVDVDANAPRPNIILVLLDDMGYSDLGFIGGDINTPTIDRLANEGVVFTQMLNASKCEPTRASLLSGLYWQNSGAGIQRGITLGHTLGAAGYRTMMTGKWDINGAPVNRGFDDALWMEAGAGNFFDPHQLYLGLEEWQHPRDGSFYITDAFTDFGIRFIEENHADDPERPFFLYLAHYAPHAPLHPLKSDWERYRGRFDAGWDVLYANRIANMRRSGFLPADVPVPERPDIIPAWDSLPEEVKAYERRRMELYAGMFDSVDRGLQRIIDRLRELGKADNTLILILSDNGANPYDRLGLARRTTTPPPYNADFRSETGVAWAWLSNAPFSWFKRNQHMGGIATPLVAWWPEGIVNPGRLIRDPTHIIDVMPTLNSLAGADYSPFEGIPSPDYRPARRDNRYWSFLEPGLPVPPLDGRDISGYFSQQPVIQAEAHYFHLFDHRSILSPPWKLSSVDGGNWELYRYPQDKAETEDLAMEYPEEVSRLVTQWESWFSTTAFEQRDIRGAGPPIRYVEPTTGRVFNPDTRVFENPE